MKALRCHPDTYAQGIVQFPPGERVLILLDSEFSPHTVSSVELDEVIRDETGERVSLVAATQGGGKE